MFIEWVIQRTQDALIKYFATPVRESIEGWGLEPGVAAIFATVALGLVAKLLHGAFTFTPTDLNRLDPNDDEKMKAGFADIAVCAALARALNENDAQSIEQFKDQVRRYQALRFAKPA